MTLRCIRPHSARMPILNPHRSQVLTQTNEQIDIYDFLHAMLLDLSVLPGMLGVYLLDADHRILVGAGELPDGGLPRLQGVGDPGSTELRRPLYHQTPAGRFYLHGLSRGLTLVAYCAADLNPGLLHRVIGPVGRNVDGMLADILPSVAEGSPQRVQPPAGDNLFWE
jgi:hypothetical protein